MVTEIAVVPLVMHLSLSGLGPAPGGLQEHRPQRVKPTASDEANEPRGQRGDQRSVPYSLHASLPERLRHEQAMRLLQGESVRVHSSGGCSDRSSPSCTSLERMRSATLSMVIDLKRRSGCDVTVTGGTEAGHAKGEHSHANGYKVDVAHSRCVDRYVTETFDADGVRGDGAAMRRSPSGAVYSSEPSHWDIYTP